MWRSCALVRKVNCLLFWIPPYNRRFDAYPIDGINNIATPRNICNAKCAYFSVIGKSCTKNVTNLKCTVPISIFLHAAFCSSYTSFYPHRSNGELAALHALVAAIQFRNRTTRCKQQYCPYRNYYIALGFHIRIFHLFFHFQHSSSTIAYTPHTYG